MRSGARITYRYLRQTSGKPQAAPDCRLFKLTHDSPTPELLSTSASLPVSECSGSLSVPEGDGSGCFSTTDAGGGGGGWAAAAAGGGKITRGGTGRRALRMDARK